VLYIWIFYYVLNRRFQLITIRNAAEAEISLSYKPMLLYNDTQINLKNGIFLSNVRPSCNEVIYLTRIVVVACASTS